MLVACLIALLLGGCGGGSASSTHRRSAPESEPAMNGVGMTAPVTRYVNARRSGGPKVERGPESLSASPCSGDEGSSVATIGLFADVPSPRCLLVSPGERIIVVNRSGSFAKRNQTIVNLRLGDYEARIGPQEAALFPQPVGRYLSFGHHDFHGRPGLPTPAVVVVRRRCFGNLHGKARRECF